MIGWVSMREDMEYISGVLDELEAIVRDASKVPMRKGWAVVDRADLLVILDEIRGSLPKELSEAESIRRECAEVVAAAEEEARRIIEDAHERAEAKVLDTELYRRSQRRAGEAVERAERYAREIQGGSEVYQDRVMNQLESWFQDSLVSVGESRQELSSSSPVRRSPMPTVEAPPAPEEPAPKENGHDRGWRASSA
jgi:cell division septum initiation protein DivIVA